MSVAYQFRDEQPQREAVLTKAALRASERLGLSARQFAGVIGVSEATVSRMKRGDYLLDSKSKPFELAVLLVRVFRSLDAVAGGDQTVIRAWMKNANTALGESPAKMILGVSGLMDVVAYLDARRAVL